MGSMADIMGQVEVSPTQLERVGFKSVHIGTLDIPMRVMKLFSSSSDAPYQATLGQAPGLIRDSGSHAHSASCVVLPAHPTAGQLEYLQARGLIRFVNFSSKGTKSLLNALKGSALKNSAGNLKPNIASVLEIDRDQSQVVEEEVFGSPKIDFFRRVLLREARPLDFFFKPIGDREPASSNPFSKLDSNGIIWESEQKKNVTHWRSESLMVRSVELSDEHEALFWSEKIRPDHPFFDEISEFASLVRTLVPTSPLSSSPSYTSEEDGDDGDEDEKNQSNQDFVQLGFSSSTVSRHVRIHKSDQVRRRSDGTTFNANQTRPNYTCTDTMQGAFAPFQSLVLNQPKRAVVLPSTTTKTTGTTDVLSSVSGKSSSSSSTSSTTATSSTSSSSSSSDRNIPLLNVELVESLFGPALEASAEIIRLRAPDVWQGREILSADAKTFICTVLYERWCDTATTVNVASLVGKQDCERFIEAALGVGNATLVAESLQIAAVSLNSSSLFSGELMKNLFAASPKHDEIAPKSEQKIYKASIDFNSSLPALLEKSSKEAKLYTSKYDHYYLHQANFVKNVLVKFNAGLQEILMRLHSAVTLLHLPEISAENVVNACKTLTTRDVKSMNKVLLVAWKSHPTWLAGTQNEHSVAERVGGRRRKVIMRKKKCPRLAQPHSIQNTLEIMCEEDGNTQKYSRPAITLISALMDTFASTIIKLTTKIFHKNNKDQVPAKKITTTEWDAAISESPFLSELLNRSEVAAVEKVMDISLPLILVGSRVSVRWISGSVYKGTVTKYFESGKYAAKHEVVYDDGDKRYYMLRMNGKDMEAFNRDSQTDVHKFWVTTWSEAAEKHFQEVAAAPVAHWEPETVHNFVVTGFNWCVEFLSPVFFFFAPVSAFFFCCLHVLTNLYMLCALFYFSLATHLLEMTVRNLVRRGSYMPSSLPLPALSKANVITYNPSYNPSYVRNITIHASNTDDRTAYTLESSKISRFRTMDPSKYIAVTLKVHVHALASSVLLEDISAQDPVVGHRGYTPAATTLMDMLMEATQHRADIPPEQQAAAKAYMKRRTNKQDWFKRHVQGHPSKCTTIDGMCLAIQKSRQDEYDTQQRVEAEQPAGLTVTLKNYQRESLSFMLECENREKIGIHDANYALIRAEDGKDILFSPEFGRFAMTKGTIRGGILAEEMGLGKTIECLSVILCNPRPSLDVGKQQMIDVTGDASVNAAHRERIERGALELGGTLVVCKVSLVGQWCEEYREKLKDKNLTICEYHGSKRKKFHKDPQVLGAFDLVVTTYETLASEYRLADKKAEKDAASEQWKCKFPTVVWNEEKEEDEYTGPPCSFMNASSVVVCGGCGSQIANNALKLRSAEMRRTGEVQAPLERFFWHRIIADESHVLKRTKTKTSQTVVMLAARNRWAVTGTPFTLNSMDVYGQLVFLGVKTGRSESKFKLQYPLGSQTLFDVCSRIMMRHSKTQKRDGVQLLTLGGKDERELPVRLTKKENELYQTLFAAANKQFTAFVVQGVVGSKPIEVYGLLAPLRKSLSGAGALNANVEDIKRRKIPAKKTTTTTTTTSSSSSSSSSSGGGSEQKPNIGKNATKSKATKKKAVVSKDGAEDSTNSLVWLVSVAGSLDTMQCTICSNVVEQPLRNSGCGHIYCLECIQAVMEGQGKVKQCPKEDCKINILRTKLQSVKDPSKKENKKRSEVLLDSKMKVLLKEIKAIQKKDSSEKSLIFSNFNDSLHRIQKFLSKKGIKSGLLNGAMTLPQRKKALASFASDADCRVFLLTMRAGSVGINLTVANHVFLLEPSFNPALVQQAIARAWRLGQKR